MALRDIGADYECVGWSEIDKWAIKAHNAVFPELAGRNYGDISYSFAWWGWVLTVVGILFAGWICYGISWLIEVIIPPYPGAYYYTCFETEAYNHEDDPDYLKRRIPFWGWISCIPNRKVKHKR